ncbi:MAG TPA: hypothetical protein VKH40_11285 [Alloacidobacterium sp.]|nr:hypothetical protein [Alloacidobacterium sp.]
MATPTQAIKIKEKNVPFLIQANQTFDNVRRYITSIEGWLWGNQNVGIANRLSAIQNDPQFKNLMKTQAGPVPQGMRQFILRLDHIAYDIKVAAHNQYECTPATANETKTLSTSNAQLRNNLDGLINIFPENSQNDGAAQTQTIVQLPSPNKTYRIDREQLSNPPAPRFWTYRIQVGTSTYGGIYMQSNICFTLISVRNALRTSLNSSSPDGNPVYVKLNAPQWLTDIVNA